MIAHDPSYNFLDTNPHLGKNIILLGLGGSYAYGTNTETSDIDLRGCALNSRSDILTNENFEQVVNNETDTTIYSFNKLVSLLSKCNPNTIEILGLNPEHYLYIHPIGHELLDNKGMFLSRVAANTFGGYATNQLHKLDNMVNNKQESEPGHRNLHAYKRGRISKHMTHLIRLYLMCLDILERGEIVTYREKEHDLLMSIRNGDYLTTKGKPNSEFFEMVKDYEKKFEYAKNNTALPEKPDAKKIREFVSYVNYRVVTDNAKENNLMARKKIVRLRGNSIVKCSQCGCLLYRSNAAKPEGQMDLINAVYCPQCGRKFK